MLTMKLRVVAFVACACLLSACGDLTHVSNVGIVQPNAENSASGALARAAGAAHLFYGVMPSAILTSGTFTDEFIGTDFVGNSGEGFLLDARRPPTASFPTSEAGNFQSLMNTRINLEYAIAALQQYSPGSTALVAQMYAYKGYVEMILAEEYCNGIPFSSIDFNGKMVLGSGTTTTDTYNMAITHFDSALALASPGTNVAYLAAVGKGRSLADLGQFSAASTAVSGVPTTFVFNLEYSSNTTLSQTNSTWSSINTGFAGIGDRQGGTNWFPGNGNGIPFVSAHDPRLPTALLGNGNDGYTPRYNFTGWTGFSSPQRLATGVEAQLIQAEAALQANHNDAATTGNGWLGILNSLRATAVTPAMAPLVDPGSYAARVDLLFYERAFWNFATANRMPDLRRLVCQYGRAADSVFPTGVWKDGLPYGTDVNFAIPTVAGGYEATNPNFKGCIDRNA
jgi:hypothetical protein